ncbi:MAG: TRAP transporter fused permease subunit [Eubacteriales bacterium]
MWKWLKEKFLAHIQFSPEFHHDDLRYSYNSQTFRRNFSGIPQKLISFLLLLFVFFMIYLNTVSTLSPMKAHCYFLSYVILLIFMLYPLKKGTSKRENYIPLYDVILAFSGIICLHQYVSDLESLNYQSSLLNLQWDTQSLYAFIGILVLAEACRRVVGPSTLWCVSLLFLYTLTIDRPMTRIFYDLFQSDIGILGAPAKVCASYVVMFIIFGSFLECIGLPQYLISWAKAIAGATVGGPGKVAVISSAFCGMVSGSSVGNTVTTGKTLVPLMLQYRYPRSFAGGVVAAASVGGQLMPPIMGSAAFLIVEFYDIPYGVLVARAMVPAFLYFLGVYFMVHFKAKKLELRGLPKKNLPTIQELLPKLYLTIPLILLMYLLVVNFPVADATIYASLLCLLLGLLDKEDPLTFAKVLKALESSSRSILPVAAACGMAGVISGIVVTTGLGQYLISAVISVSHGELFVALLMTMLFSLLLGTMIPTIVNYVIMATIGVPILVIGMGVDVVVANIFVFYFAIVSDITPPVSMASYAAAAMAKGEYLKTALAASYLSLAAYLIPFLFVLYPALLLINTSIFEIVLLLFTASAGMFAIAAGTMGYLFTHLSTGLRLTAVLSGLLMIYPETYTDIMGLVGISLLVFQQKTALRNIG